MLACPRKSVRRVAILALTGLAVFWVASADARAADTPVARERQEVDGLVVSVIPRPPQGMLAFYEARGFNAAARERIRSTCFLTVVIRNHTGRVVWLEPATWRLTMADGRVLSPLGPPWWERQWDEVGLPAAQRATFGWTQLPALRDLQPEEPVGGNITLARPGGPFRLVAHFATGAERQGPVLDFTFDDLECPSDGAS